MNKWINITFVFVVSLVLAAVSNHAVAFGDRHETPMQCYTYVSNQCTIFFDIDDPALDQCLAIGEVFCNLAYDIMNATSAWNDLNRIVGSTVTQQDGDDDIDVPDSIIWDISGGNVIQRDDDDDVDVPDILIWDIAGASMTRQNGNDDDVDIPDIIIWDIKGSGVTE